MIKFKYGYSEEHLRCDFLDNFLELLKRDALSLTEDLFDESMDLFLRLNTIEENLTMLGKYIKDIFSLDAAREEIL